jgi:hypothetical protein
MKGERSIRDGQLLDKCLHISPRASQQYPEDVPSGCHQRLAFPSLTKLPTAFLQNEHIPLTLMSPTHSAGPSSPNFQLIFNNALRVYENRTKNDLLAHPLAAQLQACQSPSSILAILRQQVHEHDRSQSHDERLTKWLDPTVNVLYAFSATLGEGVGLVCINTRDRRT